MFSAYRPHSPAVMNSSPVHGKSSSISSGGLLRPLSWPANKARQEDSEHLPSHRTLSEPYKFYSLAEDVKGEGGSCRILVFSGKLASFIIQI